MSSDLLPDRNPGPNARKASLAVNGFTAEEKRRPAGIARGLESNRKLLLEENQKDLTAAEKNGCPTP